MLQIPVLFVRYLKAVLSTYFFYYQVKNYVYWQHFVIEYCLASDSELTI